FYVQHQFVQVRALADTCPIDGITHAPDRAEGSIQQQRADFRAVRVIILVTALRRFIAATGSDLECHVEFAAGQIGDHQVRINDFNVMLRGDVAGGHRPGLCGMQPQLGLFACVHAHGDVLQIQQYVDDIFLHAFDRGVFVQYAVYAGFDNRRTRYGGQQNATNGIAERMAVAPLQRLQRDTRTTGIDPLNLDQTGLEQLTGSSLHGVNTSGCVRQPRLLGIKFDDQVLVDVRQHLITVGHGLEFPLQPFHVDIHPVADADLTCHFQCLLDAGLVLRLVANGDPVTGLDLVGGNVDRIVVDCNGLVIDQLARLGTRRGESHPVDDIVQ